MSIGDSTISPTDEKIALDSLEFEVYEEDMQLQAEHYLYQKLDKVPDLIENNSLMEDFYEEKSETNIKDFAEINKAIATYTFQNPAKEAHYTTIAQLKSEIAIKDNLLQYATTFSDSLLLLTLKDSLWGEVSEIDSLLRRIIVEEDSLQSVYADSLIMPNNAIATTRDMEDNEKVVNAIYLQTIAKGIYHFDANQRAILESIVYQCPLAGGTAVFKARSLYSLINGQFIYDDIENCNLVNMQWRTANPQTPKEVETLATLQVYPNPTSGLVTFDFGKNTDTDYRITIFTAQGQSVIEKQLKANSDKYELNISGLAKGIYIYQVQGVNYYTGKIVVE